MTDQLPTIILNFEQWVHPSDAENTRNLTHTYIDDFVILLTSMRHDQLPTII